MFYMMIFETIALLRIVIFLDAFVYKILMLFHTGILCVLEHFWFDLVLFQTRILCFHVILIDIYLFQDRSV